PAVHGPDRVGHPVVLLLIQAPALASHRLGGQAQQPVRTDLRGAALPVPAAGADVDPGRPVLVRGHGTVRGAIARGEHERDQHPAGAVGAPASGVLLRDDQDGPVLAPGDVLLVGDPGPDDLTGIGTIVGARGVRERRRAAPATIGERGGALPGAAAARTPVRAGAPDLLALRPLRHRPDRGAPDVAHPAPDLG